MTAAAQDIFSAEVPSLLCRHFDQLHVGSGLSVAVIQERAARSVLNRKELATLGFSQAQQRIPGLLLPVWTPDGKNGLYCYRPDDPRFDHDARPRKYELPLRTRVRLDVPPRCRAQIGDPTIPLWITEGQKKADALADHGLCAAALLGVWNFKGKNDFGGVTVLADFDYIAWNERQVRLVFDSDLMVKSAVRDALKRFTEHLQRKGALVEAVYLPRDTKGVDDYLLAHDVAELEVLVQAPRAAIAPAAPRLELLESAPPTLSRPLALINEHAYAATWLWVRETISETEKKGEIVRHEPPIVRTRRVLFVVRDDGVVFGPGEAQDLDALGLEIHLEELPRDSKLWRARAVGAYRAGKRPDISDVFGRLTSVYDRFIDFERSLASQSVMCELAACLSLQTWLAEAFTTLGYLWPNGERGSGKTHLGTCWALTSYLGEVVLSSGSFAALRDLADYGAALLFDDAEILSDPKKSDPNKRELFLAGNRRGAAVPIKEQRADGTWSTRWVNAFCPRGFTAIAVPDPIVASRSIILPLARTADPGRGNADPSDTQRWPCDQLQLQDDLWACGVWLLAEASSVWAEFDHEDGAIGREFEPWRPVLTVARLFERHGVLGLEARMRMAMAAYQQEKNELLDGDRTIAVVRALCSAAGDISDVSDISDISGGYLDVKKEKEVSLSASRVAELVKRSGEDDELDVEWATSRRVGRILKRLRLRQERDGRARRWVVPLSTLSRLMQSYGLDPLATNVTYVSNDTNVTTGEG